MKTTITALFLALAIQGFSTTPPTTNHGSMDFHAIYSKGNVLLTWNHLSQDGIYIVERSNDAQNYVAIVLTQHAAFTAEIQVRDIDAKPLKGLSYYRVKKMHNGKTEYSAVVPVQNIKKKQTANLIFPAEKEGENLLKKKNKGTTEIVVVEDMQGKELYSRVKFVQTGETLIAVSLDEKLETGEYLIIASSNNSIYSKKVLIQ
jgi:hypothetical protein